MPFLGHDFPAELSRYWQDDFRKGHLGELCAAAEDVLVFDLTRDVLCSLYEVEELCFVIDPMSVKSILWHSDDVTAQMVSSKLEGHGRLIHHADPQYFEIWQAYFDDFAAVARRFGTVVLNRLYFTDRIASDEVLTHGDPAVVAAANRFLDEAYDHIASTYDFIRFNAIPREMMVTGPAVPWGGPTYTHLQPEATALLADNLRGALLGAAYVPGRVITRCAIERMNRFEDLARANHLMFLERNELAAQLQATTEACQAQLDGAQRRLDALAIERDAVAMERDALRLRLDEAESRVRDLAAEHGDRRQPYHRAAG